MKNKIKGISIFILVVLVLAFGIVFIFRGRIITNYAPTVQQLGNINIKIKNDTSYISSRLVVKNRTFLKIGIDTIKYKVLLFGKMYMNDEKFVGLLLRGYKSDTLSFSLKIPYAVILKDLKVERKRGDSASYSIEVSLQYSTVFGKAEMPINKSAKLKIPQPPELEVAEVKWSKLRFRSIHGIAKIKITNYSQVTLRIKRMNYSITILEHGNLKGDYKETINIKPKGTTFVTIPIEINVNNIGKTIFQILINKDNYKYVLTLNAILESTDRLKESFHIDIVKTGNIELKK